MALQFNPERIGASYMLLVSVLVLDKSKFHDFELV